MRGLAAGDRAAIIHPVVTRAALTLALALATGGCVHFRTHEVAPPPGLPAELARFVRERIAAPGFETPRALRAVVTYDPPPLDPLGVGEAIAVELVPLWPYARGEWPLQAASSLGRTLEDVFRPNFSGRGGKDPALTLELAFTPGTYRRFTRTVYGLSVYGWVSTVIGYPTSYETVALEADVRLRPPAGGAPLVERRLRAVETCCTGALLVFFPYNQTAPSPLFFGAPVVRWEEIDAEAFVEFAGKLAALLEEALPGQCAGCKLRYERGVARCERCGAEVVDRERGGR
jgi:hypothetical protein